MSLLVALASVAWNGWNSVQIARNEASNTVQETDIAKLREANALRQKAGLPQIPLPPKGESVDMETIAAATAALVLEDIRSNPRFRGPQGVPGTPGQPGQGGRPGNDGEDGTDGASGQDGRNGRSVTNLFIDSDGNLWVEFDDPEWPAIMVGHVVGPTGPAGPQGPSGPIGPQGTPGPACGEGWVPDERVVSTDRSPLGEAVQVCVKEISE